MDSLTFYNSVKNYWLHKLETIPEVAAKMIEKGSAVGAYELDPTDPDQSTGKDWIGFVNANKLPKTVKTFGQERKTTISMQIGIITANSDPSKRQIELSKARLRLNDLIKGIEDQDPKLGTLLEKCFKIVAEDGVGTSRDPRIKYSFAVWYIAVEKPVPD